MFNFFKTKKNIHSEVNKGSFSDKENFHDVEPLAEFFQQETGITFAKQKGILQSKLSSFCKTRNINSFTECLSRIRHEPDFKQILINYLTTNESYFYREIQQVQELVKKVHNHGGRADILCAPCSTGEEPYSIAMALLEANIAAEQFNIFAIDINNEAIHLARRGNYSERSVSQLPEPLKQGYFQLLNNRYQINDRIKNKVQFEVMNIFSSAFQRLGKFDYIFSRNMLIYFDTTTKQQAKQILEAQRKNPTQSIFFGHADLF